MERAGDNGGTRLDGERRGGAEKNYQVRFCSGPDYVNEEEETIATILPGEPLVLLTLAGLSLPGASASFEVPVVLESDNEEGSSAVVVTRPE